MSRPDAKALHCFRSDLSGAPCRSSFAPEPAVCRGTRTKAAIRGRKMALIHHVVTGNGRPPIVFVHGFACAHSDWDAQVAHLSPRHQTIAVDLRGHGASPGDAAECSVERYGADVAEVMRALALPPAVLVGHSMGCRVAIEAALQAPAQTSGLILVSLSVILCAGHNQRQEAYYAEPNQEVGPHRCWSALDPERACRAIPDRPDDWRSDQRRGDRFQAGIDRGFTH